MATGKAHRKIFTPEEAELIKRLRSEGKSTDTISAILRAGKERVRRFLKENGLDAYQPVNRNREKIDIMRTIDVDYPHFKNAACAGMSIDNFYPEPFSQKASVKRAQTEKVKATLAICASCEEQEKCLEYALKAEPFGIWGGTTEGERQYLRLRLGIKCERDVIISRKSRQMSSMWQFNSAIGLNASTKHSDIVEKRLSRRV